MQAPECQREISHLDRPEVSGLVSTDDAARTAVRRSLDGSCLKTAASVGAMLLICAPLTIGAIAAFPIWDDGSLWLLFQERGAQALVAGHSDRPLMGHLWLLLAITENSFWASAFFAQAFLWPLLGVISAAIWSHYFPGLRRFAWVVACVAVAPLATKVQMVTANVALASFPSVALAYAALVLFVRMIADNERWRGFQFGAALLLLAVGILIQEYALSVVVVMLVLFAATAWFAQDAALRRRTFSVAGAVVAVTVAAYLVYFLLADRQIRADVHPSYAMKLGFSYWLTLPLKLVSAFWWGTAGGVASSLSQISFVSAPNIYAAAYGAVVALLLLYGVWRHNGRNEPTRSRDAATIGFFALAFVAGMAPMILMGRVPWDPNDGMASRFGLPVLPLGAALIVFAAVTLVRERFWALPVLLLGFAAGHAAFIEAWSAAQERKMIASLGEALQPYVAARAGHTVAVIPLPERSLGPPRQWELAARLAANWPAAVRERFWAYRFGGGLPLYADEEASRVFGPRGSCRQPRMIDREIRLVTRRGKLEALLWAEARPDGSISIEPYCIGARELPHAAASAETREGVSTSALGQRVFG